MEFWCVQCVTGGLIGHGPDLFEEVYGEFGEGEEGDGVGTGEVARGVFVGGGEESIVVGELVGWGGVRVLGWGLGHGDGGRRVGCCVGCPLLLLLRNGIGDVCFVLLPRLDCCDGFVFAMTK